MGDIRPRMCQHWVLPGTKALTYGFHPCQDHGSLVLQYETHVYLIENTGLYIAFYLSCVRCFDEATLF